MSENEFKKKLKGLQNEINNELDKYINIKDVPEKKLQESMKYSLMAGGKRLRPILIIASYRLFKSDFEKGLKQGEAEARLETFGKNILTHEKEQSIIIKFIKQFNDFMIIILLAAATISAVMARVDGTGDYIESIIIVAIVVFNAIMGLVQENKAEKSLEALQKLSSHVAKVIRDGKLTVIQSADLVPGDIVVLDTGDFIPADLRIIEAVNLKSQESALTGESVPVDKISDTIEDENIGLGDRKNLLFSSSLVTYGRGKGIVVETGMKTEVGKIAEMINETEDEETPLQVKLNNLGKTLGIVALVICAVIFVVGLLYGKAPLNMFMTAVSLAVAAIPEGLAAVSTIVLAIGVQRMVKKNAIVKKLPAVETLGSASVICSDKTGTLTQNKMTVKKVFVNGELINLEEIKDFNEELKLLFEANMLCNDTKTAEDGTLTGDPTETALIDMGNNLNFNLEKYPRIAEIPFDSDRKLMTTVHKVGEKFIVYTKGGVDELLNCCTSYQKNGEVESGLDNYKQRIQDCNKKMAEGALRVLASGYKIINHTLSDEDIKKLETGLTFIGMVGMIDPPREEAKEDSDIDIMIVKENSNITTLLNLAEFETELQNALHKNVDVIIEETYLDNAVEENKYGKLAKEIFFKQVKKDRRVLYD